MAASQSTTVPPPTTEYGGDEISALILDCGYSTTRAGFAGEDVPKSVIPTHFGYLPSTDEGGVPKLLFGDNSIHSPLPRLEIRNPVSSEGVVEDWETATKLWEYAITSRLTNTRPANPATNGLNDPSNEDMEAEMEGLEEQEKLLEEHPLLMTEPGWATGKSREKGIQIAMEEWGCPAFWLARSGVLVAFAGGKASSLVIDVGASQVSVTPVHDGLILKKGVQKSPLAGNFISQQIRLLFAQSASPVPLHPYYMVTSKSAVDAGAPSSATYRTFKPASSAPHPSFRLQEEERVLTEFKESVVQVWSGPGRLGATDDAVARSSPGRPFEMPDGWNQVFGTDRFQVVEGMFDAKAALTDADHPAPLPSQTIPALITAAIAAVDVDVRPHLLNNVIVTGGSSLLYGFTERLNQELTTLFPGPRVRMSAPGNTSERRFASWIGGSILGSLGTFHQMWISKREYEEHGAGVVERRCK